MDDFHDRLAAGDNSGKFDVPPVEGGAEPVVQGDSLGLPVATAPDLTATAPVAPERELTHAEKLVNPDLLAQCQAKVREFSVMAKVWKDVKEITTAPVSAQLTDFITGARGVFKVVDAQRKEAKRPFDEDAAAVQALFSTILAEITRTVDAVKPMQEAWLKKEEVRIAAEKAELAKVAEDSRLKAEADLLAAQERGDIGATVQAEADAKAATKLEKVAQRPVSARAGSASGAGKAMGLRRVPVVEVSSLFLAFTHFKTSPEVAACLTSLAAASARTAGVDAIEKGEFLIPGFNISIKESL